MPAAVLPVAALPPVAFALGVGVGVAFDVDAVRGRAAVGVRVGADPGRARPEGGGVLRWVTALSVGVGSVVRE